MSVWPQLTQSVLGAAVTAMGTAFTFIPIDDGVQGTPIELQGIFDDAHAEEVPDAGGEVVISTHVPVIGVRLSDFPNGREPQQGDVIQREGVTYDIVDTEPDGQGGSRIILHVKRDIC